jgi:importin subunit beta-1
MKAICDAATPSTDSTIELQVAAYECLNKVVSLYYDKMDDYMTSALYNVSIFLSHGYPY